MSSHPYKFGQIVNDEDVPYCHDNTWCREPTSHGGKRLRIAPARNHVDLAIALSRHLPGPFCILFVQVVPRAQGEAGRYQSQFLEREEVERFFETFTPLLEGDGRANAWIASVDENGVPHGQIIYDRHQIIYAYGPLERYESTLEDKGLKKGASAPLPHPHTHHYNKEFDEAVAQLLDYWEWELSPLRDQDL